MAIPPNAVALELNPDFRQQLISVVLKMLLDLVPHHLCSFSDEPLDELAPRKLTALSH